MTCSAVHCQCRLIVKMGKSNNNKLPNNLPQLQNLIKRDPESYKDEFQQQHSHFQSQLQIFQLKPSENNELLADLSIFLAQVSHCYPDELEDLGEQLREILQTHTTILDKEMRLVFCRALMLLRNKNLMPVTTLLELFFELFRCKDKILRKTLYNYIIQDIKNINAKHKNSRLNNTLQNFMYTMLRDNNATAAKMSLDVMVELYKRQIWNDTKTVNVITTACFSKTTKILVAAINFFLGTDEADDNDSEDEDEGEKPERKSSKQLLTAHCVKKKTRKGNKKLEQALKVLKKHKKKRKVESFNFSAIHLIHDPQGFAEKLLRQLEGTTDRFEVKLMMMNIISRLVGIHQLILLNLYPLIQRFLQPHQRQVTKILLYAAQASHELVPPEEIEVMIKTITNNFVTERTSGEGMAVGLNGIREICIRCPLACTPELMEYLVTFKTYKDKNVMMATRSIIQLYRQKNPELLHKRDRGKPTEALKEVESLQFGETGAKGYLQGAEILKTTDEVETVDEEENAWEEMEDDGNDSDGSWIDVHHSSDEEGEEVEGEDLSGLTAEERNERAQAISSSRILTQEDFQNIRTHQLSKQVTDAKSSRKRKAPEPEGPETQNGDLVSLANIEWVYKKRHQTKEEKVQGIMEGREGREKFGARQIRQNPHASTTNKEKAKKKTFMMMKHKVKRKQNRSYKDKQLALKSSLVKKMKSSMKH